MCFSVLSHIQENYWNAVKDKFGDHTFFFVKNEWWNSVRKHIYVTNFMRVKIGQFSVKGNTQWNYLFVANVFCFLGFWWLPGENLGHRWWAAPGNTAWPLCRDLWHGCQSREYSDCLSELWQSHTSVVPTNLCTNHCSAGPCCLHHIYTGEADVQYFFFISSVAS